MQNRNSNTLVVIYAKPDFPAYFRHPLYQELEKQGLTPEYIDTDTHSDGFYIDFLIQALQDKTQIFVYIEVDTDQKKLPENCTKILSQLHKIKEKVHILCSQQNVILSAYTRNFVVCNEQNIQKQAKYIIQNLKNSEV